MRAHRWLSDGVLRERMFGRSRKTACLWMDWHIFRSGWSAFACWLLTLCDLGTVAPWHSRWRYYKFLCPRSCQGWHAAECYELLYIFYYFVRITMYVRVVLLLLISCGQFAMLPFNMYINSYGLDRRRSFTNIGAILWSSGFTCQRITSRSLPRRHRLNIFQAQRKVNRHPYPGRLPMYRTYVSRALLNCHFISLSSFFLKSLSIGVSHPPIHCCRRRHQLLTSFPVCG